MSKFTPGPWSFSECGNGIEYEVNANKWGICIVAGGHPDEAEGANAALIADAPALLEALESLIQHTNLPAHDSDVINARALIAKHKGAS